MSRPRAHGRAMPNGDRAIILALGMAAVVIGALTIHAARAEGTQRDTADRALRQLASSAAWQYAQRAAVDLTHSARMTMLPVVQMSVPAFDADVPSATALLDRHVIRGPICPVAIQPVGFARLDLRSGALELSGHGWVAGDRERVETVLADLVAPSGARIHHHGEASMIALEGAGRATTDLLLAAIARTDDHRPVAVYGALARPTEVAALLGDVARTLALLPPDIARGRSLDSLLALSVSTAGGASILTSLASGMYGATTSLGAEAANLRIAIGLLPGTVTTVDLPRFSALGSPLLATVFVLATTLMGLAIVQARRRSAFVRARSDFVAGVSHELHAPLALIKAHAETLILGREENGDERRRFLEIVVRESVRLTRLVDGILDFSRLERRATRLAIRPVRLQPTLDVIAADFRLAAQARGSVIEHEVDSDIVVRADPEALRRVLINLIDNALKHGSERQRVRVTASRIDDRVHVTVDDEGQAIPLADRERAFERFVRLSPMDGRRRDGSGIGLAVVRELCRMQSGDVMLERAPGGGTRVRVVLPAVAVDVPACA